MSVRLGDRLDSARRRGFVGRERELAVFREVLRSDGQVVLVHGPGGVGKTALLHQYAWLARSADRRVVWLDGHELAPTAEAVTAVLAEELGTDDPGQVPGLVLLVDTAELLAPLERWFRGELIPSLAGDAIAVLSGRDRPSPVWRADLGWREVVRIVTLGNLSERDGRELLRQRGVPSDEQEAALGFTHGHPLALALVADVSAQHRFSAQYTQEVLAALLESFVDAVPSPLHQQALEACALVLWTTEPLLAALLGVPDASALFAWLRDLSIVEYGGRGLFPHDLARDALVAELRWRDPDGCAEIRRRAEEYYRQQFAAARPSVRQLVVLDYFYLHRDTSVLGPFVSGLAETGGLAAATPTAAERERILAWVRTHEGAESARICAHWLSKRPQSATVVRDAAGEARGFFMMLEFEADPVDPAMSVERSGTIVRYWMDSREYQSASPVHTFITTQLCRSYLTTPADQTLLVFADAEPWIEPCAYLDFHRREKSDFTVGGHQYAVFAHDWRAIPPLTWLSGLAERDALAPGSSRPPLTEEQFGAAVRAGLRAYGRADGLRDSPLLGTRMVQSRTASADPAEPARVLRRIIRDAATQMESSPRDLRPYRALHHTFLQPAETQAAAADMLGLPMTTYRRHLAAGEARLTEILWQRELDAR
ncbi:ATP-binding protein [Streptosporangiaceae bacterium NEAU-GS5]|nr:ATP-binding protein [Streptosporangiaceae bacterium NEAU-GS5]